MRKVFLLAFVVCALPLLAQAQFNSGSTGADGALDLSTCPTAICEVQLPESGVLNYTTVNIPSQKILRFKRNSRNTPVILLAQGNVVISGGIGVDQPKLYDGNASFGAPGPGGFYAGLSGQNGFGPGGGIYDPNNIGLARAKWVGPLSLVPIVGGSGGANTGCGGGGAIVVASSTSITITGFMKADSLISDTLCSPNSGSGGAIRLVANSINVSGFLNAQGVNTGVIRIEATNLSFTGTSIPQTVLSTINPTVISSAQPQLTIASIGGFSVPSYSGSRFDTVDLLLPNQLSDPVSVGISANNIPVGTQVQVGFVSGSPSGTSSPCNLAGTLASSQCTATISSLNRTGVTYLLATAIFTPPMSLAQFNQKGANQIAKVRLEAVLGGKPKYVFLRGDNSVIDTAKVPKEFLQYLGI